MASSACPSCQLPLEITPGMAGQELACPRCHARFTIPGTTPGAPPIAGPLPNFSEFGPSVTARRPFQHQSTSLLDLLDFSFTRYVTPLIVKITWVIALILSAGWLSLVVVGLIVSMLPEIETPQGTRRSSRPRPEIQFDFQSNELAERAGDASFAVAMRVAIVITQLVGIILFLLWIRVALEAVIVIFHMAANLKSIDDKTPAR